MFQPANKQPQSVTHLKKLFDRAHIHHMQHMSAQCSTFFDKLHPQRSTICSTTFIPTIYLQASAPAPHSQKHAHSTGRVHWQDQLRMRPSMSHLVNQICHCFIQQRLTQRMKQLTSINCNMLSTLRQVSQGCVWENHTQPLSFTCHVHGHDVLNSCSSLGSRP